MIEAVISRGIWTPAERAALAEELAATVLKAEGAPDTARSRALTWSHVAEAPEGAWTGGGARFLVRVTVPTGALSVARRRRVGKDIHALLSRRMGRPLAVEEAWILIDEVPPANWNAGGKPLTIEDVSGYMGIRRPVKKPPLA